MRRLSTSSTSREHWVVFSDIVLAVLFLFMLFIFAQYIRYQKLAIQEERDRRQEQIARLIADSVPRRYSVSVDSGQGSLQRVTFSSDLLFPTCSDQLSSSGRRIVALVGRLLRSRMSYFGSIEVEGHTDPRQPTNTADCPFQDNWELSSRRAATVVRILVRGASLEPGHLSAVGRAQFHPPPSAAYHSLDSLSDAAMRRRRRIEMVLQYSEQDIKDSLAAAGGSVGPGGSGHRG